MNIPEFHIKETTPGGKVRYTPATDEMIRQAFRKMVDDGIVASFTFTDRECLSVAAGLGIVLLDLAQKNMKPHQLITRKIKAVETAVADLFKGTGEKLSINIAEGVLWTWSETMKKVATDGIDDSLIIRG